MNIKFIYLHGFSSGPNSLKARYFKKKVKKEFGKDLILANLNQPSFEFLSMQAQIDHVESLFDNERVILIASSMGAYIASLLAERNLSEIIALILLAPAYEFVQRRREKLGKDFLGQWKKDGFIEIEHSYYKEKRKLHFNILDDSEKFEKEHFTFKQTCLVFHGLQDESVPYEVTQKYLGKKSNCKIKFVEDNHGLIQSLDEIWKDSKILIETFLEEGST